MAKQEAQKTNVAQEFKATPEQPVDYEGVLNNVTEQFPMVQIIDKDGNVVRDDIMPDLSDEQLVELMERMVFSRTLHEETTKLARQGRLGFYAPTMGQEASQLASAYAFEEGDWVFPGYRDVPQVLSQGASIAEGFLWSLGHPDGNYYQDGKVNAVQPQIIIGAQLIQAMGNAVGQKLNGSKNVTFTYTGDGGSSQGDTYEALNFAGRYKAPIVFYFQNNGYAISTPRYKQTAAETLAQKSVAAGIPGVQVDGQDPLAVYVVSKQAREWAAAGNGPVLIETITSRMAPHSTAGDDPKRYRDQESFDYWEERDPLKRYRVFLGNKGLWDEEKEEAFVEQAKEQIAEGIKEAEAARELSVSESLEWMYENPGQNIKEQIEIYKAKENK